MDYEKLYKEALERAKKWYYAPNADKIPTYANKIISEIFPELKESEDESIRKEIIQFLQLPHPQFVGKRNYENWIAWLEKQGEQPYWKPSEEQLQTLHTQLNEGAVTYPEDKRILFTLYEDLMKIMTQEEKQSEQKPFDKVEPKFKVGDWIINPKTGNVLQIKNILLCGNKGNYEFDNSSMPIESVDGHYKQWTVQDVKDKPIISNNALREGIAHFGITQYQIDNWLKKYVDVEKQGEQKSAWSEEDETNLEGIISEIEANKHGAPDYDLMAYDRFLTWLKSLKYRVRPKQDQSEDDKMISKLIKHFEWEDTGYRFTKEDCLEATNWLKSLKPQPKQDQSEDDKDALGIPARIIQNGGNDNRKE